ncbi:MAG: GspE/PulE family protein [Cycloclasticus sp.]
MAVRLNPTVLLNAAIESGLIDAESLAELTVSARRNRTDLLDVVMHKQRFPLSALYQSLANVRGLTYVSGEDLVPDAKLLQRMPISLVKRKALLPLGDDAGEIVLATPDPDDRTALDSVRRLFGKPLRLVIAEPDAIAEAARAALGRRYAGNDEADKTEFEPAHELDEIFKQAWLQRASDIHIEPHSEKTVVRLRVDGELQKYRTEFEPDQGASILSRAKVLANLDIAEQREAQDGGISYQLPPPAEHEIDVRVATIPTRWGERMTMRLLGQETQDLTLESIGMPPATLGHFREAIARPYGLILLTGPTGSGKTTTLYGALREINKPGSNIMTVEDPVEYLVDGISQIQVTGKISFAGALRSFLRHDPDIMMVGEIRDAETADVALKAAMTGHLVFSTLHTNDAASAVTRLVDIGAERFLLAASLIGVIAQRLVRRLCVHCKTERTVTEQEQSWLADIEADFMVYEPKGCPACVGSGYRGRIGLYESLWIDPVVADLIGKGASEKEISRAAKDLTTLWEDGCDKVKAGLTSFDEVRRVAVFTGGKS